MKLTHITQTIVEQFNQRRTYWLGILFALSTVVIAYIIHLFNTQTLF